LEALRSAGWRLIVSAKGVLRHEGFRYGLDNGAWTSHQRNQPFDVTAFEQAVDVLGAGADWIVLPDVVLDGPRSLAMALDWLPRLSGGELAHVRKLIAVQNGLSPEEVRPYLSPLVGVFVGGDDGWKEKNLGRWAALAKSCQTYVHVGRVNTARRIRLCADAGVDSFDGSSVSRYALTIGPLNRAVETGRAQLRFNFPS